MQCNGAMICISVIVPAYNSAATLGATLEALARQEVDVPYEVIVVDDGSADQTVAVAERFPGPVAVLRQDHQGPGPARNRGAELARARLLAFTDADCAPTPSWLRAGLQGLTNADLVQGVVRPDPQAQRYPLERSVWVTREIGLYETANMFVTRELFERLGGFEDWLQARIGKPLAEDVWFGWRARRAGARIAFSEDAVVHHAVFRQRVRDFVAERRRLRYFADMAQKIPELRKTMFYWRLFLNRRTAAFDLGLVSLAAAAAISSFLPLVGAAPYAWMLTRQSVPWRLHAPSVAFANLLADVVGFAALIQGSVGRRTPVL
jgi:glycosyltransferase involved in cell wall biosynthesis